MWSFNNNYLDGITGWALAPVGGVSFTTDRFGDANKAIYLNNGYFIVNPASASIWFNGELTISLWAYIVKINGAARYFHCGTKQSTFNQIQVFSNDDHDFGWGITDLTKYIYSSNPPIIGQWVHRAVVVQNNEDSYTSTVYTNLVAYGNATQSAPYLASNNLGTCYIGLSWWGEVSYDYIDDMVFFRRALNMPELKRLKSYNF